MGVEITEPTLAQAMGTLQGSGRTSFQDRLCFNVARDKGWALRAVAASRSSVEEAPWAVPSPSRRGRTRPRQRFVSAWALGSSIPGRPDHRGLTPTRGDAERDWARDHHHAVKDPIPVEIFL